MSAKRAINRNGSHTQGKTFVPAVAPGGQLLFMSGVNAIYDGVLPAPGDVAGQVRLFYQKLAAILESGGGSLRDVVKRIDYILSRDGYRETAEVRRQYLAPDFPAATGVIVKELLDRGVLIEIEAIAVLSEG